MKRTFTLAFTFFALTLSAQQVQRCHTTEITRQKIQEDPGLEDRLKAAREEARHWLQNNQHKTADRAVITIPVVVHVIHNGENVGDLPNLSDEQIQSQIDALNEDYRKLNSDISSVPSVFQGVIADCEIEFCLAQTDENGLPTNGIDRYNSGSSQWNAGQFDSQIKPVTTWDRDDYLNIWTVNMGGGLLGYATPPGSNPNQDGVVVDYRYFGVYPSNPVPGSFDLGRTATHEVGHWLGLAHTFEGGCSGTTANNCSFQGDFICDTPPTANANYGCNFSPSQNTCTETPTDQIDMWMNFMDYSDDACLLMFTTGQSNVMTATLNTTRSSILSSLACAAQNYITYSGQVIDAITSDPVANASVLFIGETNVEFEITTDAGGNFTFNNFLEGTYEVYAGKWGYRTNQYSQSQFVDGSTPGIVIPIESGIYYDDFLMDFAWEITGNAATGMWTRDAPIGTEYQGAASNPGDDVGGDYGLKCYVTGNAGGNAGTDDVDDGNTVLTSPVFDLTGYQDPYLSYRRWFFNDGGQGVEPDDELIITLTNGTTSVELERLSGSTENMWTEQKLRVQDVIARSNNMQIILETADQSGSGHLVEAGLDLFMVKDSVPVSAGQVKQPLNRFHIFPNPAKEQARIQFSLATASDYRIAVLTTGGQAIQSPMRGTVAAGALQTITLETSDYTAGIYLIRLTTGNHTAVQKLVVIR